MRKIAVALGAIAFAFATSVLTAEAATKPDKAGTTAGEPVKTKKLVKKATPSTSAKYKSRCKYGEKWDASATLNAGACIKTSKVRVKTAPKSAETPAAKPAVKKVG